jgi:DNA-binding response OmpR family regulator
VLLVDDDRALCAMLGEYLAAEGCVVESAHDGESGAARAVAEGFDVVVLDVMMPRMGGFEALRTIRRASAVPVLMLTAKGDDVDRIVGLEIGADDYPAIPASWWRGCGPSCAAPAVSSPATPVRMATSCAMGSW